MLEWPEVRLDLGYNNRLMYEYRIEPLNSHRDALKQRRLARIACSGTQPPTHLSEKIQRARSYCPKSFNRDWYKKKTLGRQDYLASFR